MAIKRYKRLKSKRRPKDPYPYVQGWDFIVIPNFPDMKEDLSELYYNYSNPPIYPVNYYNPPSHKTDLGPVYAICENYIRFGVLEPGTTKATAQQALTLIVKTIFEPIDNFDFLKVLKETRNIIRRYKTKYGNDKWRKDIKYVGKGDPNRDVSNWKWIKRGK